MVAYIEATLEDYRTAYELAQTVLKASLHELSPVARELLDKISHLEGEFTRREVRELTGWAQTRLVETLNELEGMEYIAKTAGSNGTVMRYSIVVGGTPTGPSPLKHILHPDQLAAILQAETKKKP